ncbi:hypothetical protein HAX54_028091, partial [Datura stramonium]|nr:hypothetical protein [Datura stramonium]
MTSKGKEVFVAYPSVKRTRKGKTGAGVLRLPKPAPRGNLEQKTVETHGLTWFNTQKEVKYAPKNWIDEGHLALEFLAIRDKIRELGAGYIFNEPERCNLTLLREFYANWDSLFEESTKINIEVVVQFKAKRFNAFLETPTIYPSVYFILLEKPPYRDICHTLCGEHSSARW